MARFKIGDRVRILPHKNDPPDSTFLNGQIGTICHLNVYRYPDGSVKHKIEGLNIPQTGRWLGFSTANIVEFCLELVPPDKEQTVPWSQCVFKPKELEVNA